jgi:hypothetical protein
LLSFLAFVFALLHTPCAIKKDFFFFGIIVAPPLGCHYGKVFPMKIFTIKLLMRGWQKFDRLMPLAVTRVVCMGFGIDFMLTRWLLHR